MLFLDADTIVRYANLYHVSRHFGCGDLQHRFDILFHIFQSIVQEIEDYVGELHLIDIDIRLDGIKLCSYTSTLFFDFEFEGIHDVIDDGIGIYDAELQRIAGLFEHR